MPYGFTIYDKALGLPVGMTAYRDLMVAPRYTVWGDSLADGVSAEWTQTLTSGGTVTTSGGQGVLQTSASATGAVTMIGPIHPYLPGQVDWINSSVELPDTGSVGNTRRWGRFTVNGSQVPQDGFAFELIDTTFYFTSFKGGVATRTPTTSASKFATDPFTLTTDFIGGEIRFTTNTANFFIGNVLRHTASGGSTAITNTLNLPIAIQNINTSGATNRVFNIRNIGQGRFGSPEKTGIKGAAIAPLSTTFAAGAVQSTAAYSATEAGNVSFIIKNTTAASPFGTGGAVVFEQSDDGISWGPLVVIRNTTGEAASTHLLGANTASGEMVFEAGVEAVNWVRARTIVGVTTNSMTLVIQGGGLAFNPIVTSILNPTTAGGLTTAHLVSAATTNAISIKGSPGQVYGWYIYNSSTTAKKVNLHNTAGTPTAGTGVLISLVIPPTSGANVHMAMGLQFNTGIGMTTTGGLTDADNTAVAANDLVINIFFK